MFRIAVDMRLPKVLALFFLIICSGCNSSLNQVSDNKVLQDKACRQTIQNLYSTEFYCPNNLKALQALFTDSFRQRFPVTLDRCNDISHYKITKLLSSSDPNYPKVPDSPIAENALMYYVEVEVKVPAGKSMPGNNPSTAWIAMLMTKSGECKISDINGGG